jgi:hypothetical protein
MSAFLSQLQPYFFEPLSHNSDSPAPFSFPLLCDVQLSPELPAHAD